MTELTIYEGTARVIHERAAQNGISVAELLALIFGKPDNSNREITIRAIRDALSRENCIEVSSWEEMVQAAEAEN